MPGVDHLRGRSRAVADLHHVPPRQAEPEDHARTDHGARCRPQSGPLLRDGYRRRLPRQRAREHRHHRAALRRRPRFHGAQRGGVAGAPRQLAVGRHVALQSHHLGIRLCRRAASRAREQEDLPQPDEDRRRRTFGGRAVRQPLRDVEQGARHARQRAGELRRRQSVELRVARCSASASDGRCEPRGRVQGIARAARRRSARELHLRTVRREQGGKLRQVAGRARGSRRLHGRHERRSAQEEPRLASHHVPAGPDVLPLGGFDSSPSAMAQGPTRRARGEAFYKYVNGTLGANHKAIIVPECGHNDRCIYTTDIVFPVIFP